MSIKDFGRILHTLFPGLINLTTAGYKLKLKVDEDFEYSSEEKDFTITGISDDVSCRVQVELGADRRFWPLPSLSESE